MENLIEPGMDRKIANLSKNHIPGWGMDADPDNDPTYPMKHSNGDDHKRLNYDKAPQQHSGIEMLHSIERPGLTRVFGTSTPPKGLSGVIRRKAFKYSEAQAAHWMMLLLADRVDVVQGIIDDIRHGVFPNIVAENGWGAEWKYNRKKLVTRLAIKAIAIVAITWWLTRKKKRII